MSMENGSDALSLSYDATKKGFRTIAPNIEVLAPFQAAIDAATFTYISVAYPTTSSEVYSLKASVTGSTALTFTVNYVDESKTEVLNILKA